MVGFDFVRCLAFIKDDPRWLPKLLIGSGVFILATMLVGMPLLWGYSMRIVRRSAAGVEPALPEWDDWGGLFTEGLKVAAVFLAHYLAVALVLVPLFFAFVFVPDRLPDALAPLVAVAAAVLMLVAVVLLVVLAVYIHAALTRLAILGDFAAAFSVGENVAYLRRNLGNTGLAWVVFLLANFVSQFGILLCCVGMLPAAFWAMAVMFVALGEVARHDPGLSQAARAIA